MGREQRRIYRATRLAIDDTYILVVVLPYTHPLSLLPSLTEAFSHTSFHASNRHATHLIDMQRI